MLIGTAAETPVVFATLNGLPVRIIATMNRHEPFDLVAIKDIKTNKDIKGRRIGYSQGVGGALLEEMVYDEQGQLLTGTFMDYLVPTAMELPPIETVHLEYPSPRNPLGVKGVGEGGAISPPAAIANAVEDALAPFNVRVTRTPLGPSVVLGLIEAARNA